MPKTLPSWLADLEKRHYKAVDLGLERCGRVYLDLDSPRPARKIFTVAGTNGKGSVVAYLASILEAAGLRCGVYTSPHLLRFNERIRVAGRLASDAEIVAAFEWVERARAGVSLTYFEFTTLAAFHLMQAARLDVAVLEVGLGGRLDAVNLVDPDCAVITPIGLDHEEFLGSGRESVGREKAGIMRRGRPVVCGDRHPPTSLVAQAGKLPAPLLLLGRDFTVAAEEGKLQYRVGPATLALPPPPLPGAHQADNLATALAALGQLYPGLMQELEVLHRGVAETRLAGRLERSTADRRVILDVGHNPLAATVVAEFLDGINSEIDCVLAMLRDKDAEAVAGILGPRVNRWFCAGLEGPRGQSGAALAGRVTGASTRAAIEHFESVAAALSAARQRAGDSDTILVFGSFETVAQSLRCLGEGQARNKAMLIES